MLLSKQKKAQISKGNRILITITFLGSAGPMRFVVYDKEVVAAVVDVALKNYAREGRLPVLGSNLNDFLLCCPAAGSEALELWESIGLCGGRNFMLCKKPQPPAKDDGGGSATPVAEGGGSSPTKKGGGRWKSWINRSLSFKIASH